MITNPHKTISYIKSFWINRLQSTKYKYNLIKEYLIWSTKYERKNESMFLLQHFVGTRVFIGFSFKPRLSGERSSGEIHDGLSGLRGLSLTRPGRYSPNPMKKNSIGINIACGCSSVTNDPQACTSNFKQKNIKACSKNLNACSKMTRVVFSYIKPHTSTKALYFLSNAATMWRVSEWKGDWSPTNMSVRHFKLLNPSVMSCLLLIASRNRLRLIPCLSPSSWINISYDTRVLQHVKVKKIHNHLETTTTLSTDPSALMYNIPLWNFRATTSFLSWFKQDQIDVYEDMRVSSRNHKKDYLTEVPLKETIF